MKFCPSCGVAVEPTDKFCGGCGSKLAGRSAAPPPAPPAAPAQPASAPRATATFPPPATAEDEDPEKTILISRPRPAAPAQTSASAGVKAPPPPSPPEPPPPPPRQPTSSSASGDGYGAVPPPPPPGDHGLSGSDQADSLPDPIANRGSWFAWLLARVKGIILNPSDEWQLVDRENTLPVALYKSYIAPLAVIGPIASFIGMVLIGVGVPFLGTVRIGVVAGIGMLLTSYILGMAAVYVVALIANALAPSFKGEQNMQQALKLVAYAYTPAWVAGVLGIIPALGILTILAALYSLYLLYLGLPVMMKCPREKAVGYTIVLIIIGIIVGFVASLATAMFMPRHGIGSGASIDPSSPAGSILGGIAGKSGDAAKGLEAMTQKMEQASKKMEAAQKSGDPNAAAAAAGEMLGNVLAGGRKVDPVDFQQLKALLPEAVFGLARTSVSGEKTAMGPVSVSHAEGSYGDGGGRRIRLKLTDMGGAGLAMSGLAAWSMIEMDKETEDGRERTGKLDGRPFHERFNQRSQSGEFDLVVAQRFLIEAEGDQVDLATLKASVAGMNLARLESMKDVGAAK